MHEYMITEVLIMLGILLLLYFMGSIIRMLLRLIIAAWPLLIMLPVGAWLGHSFVQVHIYNATQGIPWQFNVAPMPLFTYMTNYMATSELLVLLILFGGWTAFTAFTPEWWSRMRQIVHGIGLGFVIGFFIPLMVRVSQLGEVGFKLYF